MLFLLKTQCGIVAGPGHCCLCQMATLHIQNVAPAARPRDQVGDCSYTWTQAWPVRVGGGLPPSTEPGVAVQLWNEWKGLSTNSSPSPGLTALQPSQQPALRGDLTFTYNKPACQPVSVGKGKTVTESPDMPTLVSNLHQSPGSRQ